MARSKDKAPKEPPKEKPKAITIHTVKRTRRFISIDYDLGDENHKVRTNENPLPSFHSALDAMNRIVEVACHFPRTYVENGLKIISVKLGSQGDVATVSVVAQKSLADAAKALPIVTPPRLLAHPVKPGTYTPPLNPEDKELVDTLIAEAKAYVKGERAQGTLKYDDDEEEGDGSHPTEDATGTAPLPFQPDNGGTGTPARKRRTAAPKTA